MNSNTLHLLVIRCCALGICLALIDGCTAHSRLTEDVKKKLTVLEADLENQAVKADGLAKEADQNIERFKTIRAIAMGDGGSASESASTNLRLAFDGMDIFLRSFKNQAGLNRDSLRILEGVADDILSGEHYKKLDESLQQLETTQTKRDDGTRALSPQFEQLVGVFQFIRRDSREPTVISALDVVETFIVSQRFANVMIVDQYEQGTKPATEVLRGIVDQLAKNGG